MRPNKADSTRNILVRPQAIKPKEALSYSVESSWTSQAAKPSAGTNSAVLRQAKRQVDYHNPFGRQPWCCLLYLFFLVDFLEAREAFAVPFYLLEEHLFRANPVLAVAIESLIDYHPFLCL